MGPQQQLKETGHPVLTATSALSWVPLFFKVLNAFFGIQRVAYFGTQKFWEDTKTFFGKQKFLVDKNPKTSQKLFFFLKKKKTKQE